MNERAVSEPAAGDSLRGRRVVTADGVTLGMVDGETESHIRVMMRHSDAPEGHVWLPRVMMQDVERRTIRLNRNRADLHDAVLSLSPGEQREYATLGLTATRLGRARGLGHAGR